MHFAWLIDRDARFESGLVLDCHLALVKIQPELYHADIQLCRSGAEFGAKFSAEFSAELVPS